MAKHGIITPSCRTCGIGVEYFGDYCQECQGDGEEMGIEELVGADLHALAQHMADEDY